MSVCWLVGLSVCLISVIMLLVGLLMWVDLSDKPAPAQATNMSHHHNLNTYKAHWTNGKRNFLRREATSTNYFVRPVTVRSSVSINDNHNKECLKIHENPIGQVQGVH